MGVQLQKAFQQSSSMQCCARVLPLFQLMFAAWDDPSVRAQPSGCAVRKCPRLALEKRLFVSTVVFWWSGKERGQDQQQKYVLAANFWTEVLGENILVRGLRSTVLCFHQ